MKILRTFGLAVILTALLSLIGASSALAFTQLADDAATGQPGETVSVNILLNDPDYIPDYDGQGNPNLIIVGSSCFWGGSGGVVSYTAGLSDGDVSSCTSQVVNVTNGDFGIETFVVTTVVIDTVDPIVQIDTPSDGDVISTDTTVLSYTATDDSGVTPVCDRANGETINLDEGLNTITVTCTDAAGNVGSVSVDVTYTPPSDTIAPVITIDSPADGSTVSTNTVALNYTVSDNEDPSPICTPESGPDVVLSPGLNTITVTCTDASNNQSSVSVDVTYTTAPVEIFVSDATAHELDAGQGLVTADFQVTLSRSTDVPIYVSYLTIPWTANLSDFVMTAGTLTIPAGQTTGQISVTIKADNKKEATEIFKLLYFSCDSDQAQIADPVLPGLNAGVATATITDDDSVTARR